MHSNFSFFFCNIFFPFVLMSVYLKRENICFDYMLLQILSINITYLSEIKLSEADIY